MRRLLVRDGWTDGEKDGRTDGRTHLCATHVLRHTQRRRRPEHAGVVGLDLRLCRMGARVAEERHTHLNRLHRKVRARIK